MIWWVISIVVILLFLGYVFYLWQTGRFKKTFMSMRIITWMIALEIFGLLLMILALILFWLVATYETFSIAEALLRIGLICAIPPALFLTIYFLMRLLGAEETVVYAEDPRNVNQQWFITHINEQEENVSKTDELILRLEEERNLREKQIKELQDRINEKDTQIAALMADGELTGNVDSEKLAELEREKEELQKQLSELTQGQEDAEAEKEELQRERELLEAERTRLEEDKQKFEELQEAKEQAELAATEEADALAEARRIEEYEKQILLLQQEQVEKVQELESELDSMRDDLEHAQAAEEVAEQLNEATEEELARLREELAEERMRQEAENYRKEQELESQIAAQQSEEAVEELQAELNAARIAHLAMQEQFAEQENEQLAEALARIQALEGDQMAKKQRATERRRLATAKRREMLSRDNLNIKIKRYFIELAACFLMDREAYKDRFGVSPYNRIVVNEDAEGKTRVSHLMTATTDKLYKFSENLLDADTLMRHPQLFPMYMNLVEEGVSLIRISEKLHLMYLQYHRKDFVKDFRYKEDFENLLVIASNHYVTSGMDFRNVFPPAPFDPSTVSEQEIAAYLDSDQIKTDFNNYFPNYADLGFNDMYQAMAIAFFASQKEFIEAEKLVQVILKDAERVAKELRRLNKPSRRKKASE